MDVLIDVLIHEATDPEALRAGAAARNQTAQQVERIIAHHTTPEQAGEVFATLYHNLGLDVSKTTIPDLTGRPQFLVDGYSPMRELV